MSKPHYTNQFKKDYKLAKKRGKDITKLNELLRKIIAGTPLEPHHKHHRLPLQKIIVGLVAPLSIPSREGMEEQHKGISPSPPRRGAALAAGWVSWLYTFLDI